MRETIAICQKGYFCENINNFSELLPKNMNKQSWRSLRPAIPYDILSRPKLETKLSADSLAYWVSAPAGYGKTIGTIHWLKNKNKNFSWISCQENNLLDIKKSIQNKIKELEPEQDLYYVLDNAEKLSDNDLLNHIPDWIIDSNYRLRPIVISRNTLVQTQNISGFNSHLKIINASDLAFTEQEIKQYIAGNQQQNKSRPLTFDFKQTLGWPIFVAHLKEDTNINDSFLLNYIKNEVWPHLPNKQQQALRLFSGLNKVSQKLINAEFPELSIIKLQDLKLAGFMQNTEEHTWYQLHPVIQEYLNECKLITINNNQIKSCALWLQQHSRIDDAIELLKKYQLNAEIAEIVRQESMQLRQRGLFKQLNGYLDQLPDELIFTDPNLLIAYIWSVPDNLRLIRNQQLEKKLEQLIIKQEQYAEGDFSYLMCELSNIRAYHQHICGNAAAAKKLAEQSLEYAEEAHTSLRSRAYLTISLVHFLNGETKTTIETLHIANKHAKYENDIYAIILIVSYLAENYRLRGDTDLAIRIVDNNSKWFHERGFSKETTTLWFNHAKAATFWEQGKYDQAENLFATLIPHWQGMDYLQQLGYLRFKIDLYISQSNFVKALELLQELEFISNESTVKWRFGRAETAAIRCKINLYKNDWNACNLWTDTLSLDSLEIDFQNEDKNLILLRSLCHTSEARKLIPLIKKVSLLAKKGGRERNVIRGSIIEALVYHHANNKTIAQQRINQAIEIAEARSIKQPFMDEAGIIEPYIDKAIANQHAQVFCTQIKSYINKIAPQKEIPRLQSSPLSKREIEVLGLLAMGLTRNDISLELKLSPGTIKTHTKHIYTKLSVKNKTQALIQAEKLGWLK